MSETVEHMSETVEHMSETVEHMSEREALGVAAMQVLRHMLSAAVTTELQLPFVAVFVAVAMQISVVFATFCFYSPLLHL
jgi:hypothetical protein